MAEGYEPNPNAVNGTVLAAGIVAIILSIAVYDIYQVWLYGGMVQ
jgi:hypothetical protein